MSKISTSEDEVVDLDNPKPSADAVLPCVAALDFLAEANVREGGAGVQKAVEIWKSLANIHDTMRKKLVFFSILFISMADGYPIGTGNTGSKKLLQQIRRQVSK